MNLQRWANSRRQHQERAYEQLIVNMAREVVDPATKPERREQARDSLINACSMVGAYHSMNASALYLGAIKRASQEGITE